jgi:hypothetical protein
MERTVWIAALALAALASLSCKDSTPNYISFDAQAPAQAVDAKPDAPPKIDAGSPSDAVDSAPIDDGGNGQ